jgi:PBP1b-binding outer membrane lipoprotein LpoB
MNAKILGGVLFGALAMTGCGGDAGTATNAAKNVAATNAGKTAVNAVTNAATNATGVAGALPADFPKDIPVYTGATVIGGGSAAGGKGASFSTADDAAKVADYYEAELKKQGWTDVKKIAAGPATSITATKEKRMLAIGLTKGTDGKTMISVGETAKP